MDCSDDAVTLENTGRQGDVWWQSWTRTVGSSSYDIATLLVQIRTDDGVLVASSPDPGIGDAVTIDVSASDFTGPPLVFAWETTSSTADVDPTLAYVLEAQCEIDGRLTTFYHHEWVVLPEYAIEGAA